MLNPSSHSTGRGAAAVLLVTGDLDVEKPGVHLESSRIADTL